jgi:hypothetical protein
MSAGVNPKEPLMTCLNPSPTAPGSAPTLHSLSSAQTAQAFLSVEHAVIGALAILGREMFGAGLGLAPEPALDRSDAAALEYASWLPDPGAIEVASWAAYLQPAAR